MSQGVGTLLRVRPEAKLLNSPSTGVVAYACPPSANIGGMRQPGCPTKNVGNASRGDDLRFLASILGCRRQLKLFTESDRGCRRQLKPPMA